MRARGRQVVRGGTPTVQPRGLWIWALSQAWLLAGLKGRPCQLTARMQGQAAPQGASPAHRSSGLCAAAALTPALNSRCPRTAATLHVQPAVERNCFGQVPSLVGVPGTRSLGECGTQPRRCAPAERAQRSAARHRSTVPPPPQHASAMLRGATEHHPPVSWLVIRLASTKLGRSQLGMVPAKLLFSK